MANCGRETKFTAFLRSFQKYLVVLRFAIVYLAGSYFFWFFSFPFMYEAIASCNGIERLGYLFAFVFSPITVPLFLLAGIFYCVFLGENILELLLFWTLAALSYVFTYFLVWIHIRVLGALIKKSADSNV